MRISLTQIGFLALAIMIAWNIYLHKRNKDLKTNIQDRDITIQSMNVGIQEYKAKDGSWNQRLINERLSADQIANSKDSIIIKMRSQLQNANIKLQNALALGYTKQVIQIDTVVKYVPRTTSKTDTTATLLDFSKPPYITNVVVLRDSSASNNLLITNEQFLATNAKKEFVNRRRSFFLWRWFQRMHWIIYSDIHNSNPYIKTLEAKYITIVENDGTTKNIKK